MAGQAVVTIRDKQWLVSLANTPWELAQGLGGITEMSPETGMIFDLGSEQIIQVTTIPMLFSLDIVFFSEALVVTELYRDIQPGYLVASTLPARYFLEVNAGELEGIDSGDRVSVEFMPLEDMPVEISDWMSIMVSFLGFLVMGVFLVSMVRDFAKAMFEEPKVKPMVYGPHGERLLPDTIMEPDESLAREILAGLGAKGLEYRAYVKFPKDKSAFVTLGSIIGGHYSWNPQGFTVWVDAWERDTQYPSDTLLGIRELRRGCPFVATEAGVMAALDYIDREFPTFTEHRWVSKSIPIYVAMVLSILNEKLTPESFPSVAVMPKLPEEAKGDILFFEYIRDMVRLGERVTDKEAEIMWEAWKKRGSHPARTIPKSSLPEPLQTEVRRKLRKEPTWRLKEVYQELKAGQPTNIEVLEKHRDHADSAVAEILWERGGLPEDWEPSVIPTGTTPRPHQRSDLKYFADSPEYLTQTIDATGYRGKIDTTFQRAISRAKGLLDIYEGFKGL